MPDFTIRSNSVNVEEIMEQIRARIRQKRGVDYTEQQIRELAQVKLERILDPRGVRSDLLEAFRQQRPPYEPPVVPSLDLSFESHRPVVRLVRRLLLPVLKLFFNPAMFVQALKTQQAINDGALEREISRERQRRDLEGLQFEVMHNLVFELTRMGIEVKNLRMRVESLSSRLDFMERRARNLESAMVYKPSAGDRFEAPPPQQPAPAAADREQSGPAASEGPSASTSATEGPGQRSRRRRRRRGRRGRTPAAAIMGTDTSAGVEPALDAEAAASGENTEGDLGPPADISDVGDAGGDEGNDES